MESREVELEGMLNEALEFIIDASHPALALATIDYPMSSMAVMQLDDSYRIMRKIKEVLK